MHSRIKPQTLGAQRLVQWGLVVRQHEAARWQRGGTKEGQQRDAELPGRLRSDTRLAEPGRASLSTSPAITSSILARPPAPSSCATLSQRLRERIMSLAHC